MASLRILAITTALIVFTATLGGCAIPETPLDSSGESNLEANTPDSGSADQSGTEAPTTLADVATALADGDGGDDVARSYGSTSISTNANYDLPPYYSPGYDPDDSGDSGNGTSDDGSGADDGSNAGDGSDTSDGGGDDGETPPAGALSGTTYGGSLTCHYSESLDNMTGPSEDRTYRMTITLSDEGVPVQIPVPPFIANSDTYIMWVGVHYPEESETHMVPFGHSGDDLYFTMTITVASAEYTAESVHVTFDIDVSWYGDHSSMTASGTHTVEMLVDQDSLAYSAVTHYDGHFVADDDWEGDGTVDHDCSGTLTRY